jgi:hypothetical protein
MQIYELHVASTGERIEHAETDLTLLTWQKRRERKLLRYKRTPERVKAAIRAGDTIAGWADSDAYRATVTRDEFRTENRRIFRGYDKWYEKRAAQQSEAV